jgi:hypothetical protein
MNPSELKELISSFTKGSWLSTLDFSCPQELLEKVVVEFQEDYNRWYPGILDIEKLCVTPQLISVLAYRMSHRINALRGG